MFTNLTQDHLDFHGTLEAYRDAKSRLFRAETRGDTTKRFTGVVNMDDEAGRWIREECEPPAPILGFGVAQRGGGDGRREDSCGAAGTSSETPDGRSRSSPLRGAFNVENALAAFAGCVAVGTPPATVAAALESVASVPGRLEPVDAGQPFQVLVDYAHTPDALRRALEAVRARLTPGPSVSSAAAGTATAGSGPSWARSPPECGSCLSDVRQPAERRPARDPRGDRGRGAGRAARAHTAIVERAEAIAAAIGCAATATRS